jgi:hypothetical protein
VRIVALISCSLLSFAAGCSSSSDAKALSPYASATLTAGSGLGDLRLGTTTLSTLVNTVGSGAVTAVASDESAVELTFLGGQMSFMFVVAGDCQTQTGGPGARLPVTQDMKAFLSQYPACGNLPLSSISVGAGPDEDDTFYQGATDQGIKLWANVVDSGKHGIPSRGTARLVAGGSATDNTERTEYPGIAFFHKVAGATPDEMASGRPLPPERLKEIEQAKQDTRITRITIFLPDA